jgi:hypothetical protein
MKLIIKEECSNYLRTVVSVNIKKITELQGS